MPGSTASASSKGDRVLVVGVNWIGDTIMSMPALQAFQRAHPAIRVTLLVKGGLAPLWSMYPGPHDVLTYEDGVGAAFRAAREIRGLRFARAYVFPHSFRSAVIPFLARVPERIGMPGHSRDFLLTHVVMPNLRADRLHQGFEYGDILDPAAVSTTLELPALAIPAERETGAREQVRALPRPLLGVMPGAARGPSKRWPSGHFADVARRWIAERKGGVLLLGGREDVAACAAMARELGPAAMDLAGRTTVIEWAAFLRACDVVVANDSGGMHLAAAAGTPVVAVYGMTDPARTGPLGRRCRVVQDEGARARDIARDSAEAQKRLAAISPERVYGAVLEASAS